MRRNRSAATAGSASATSSCRRCGTRSSPGLIIVAALSIGEFQFSNLVAGFLNRTYPVVLLQAFYGATGFACAATVILLLLALAAAVGGRRVSGGTARMQVAAA